VAFRAEALWRSNHEGPKVAPIDIGGAPADVEQIRIDLFAPPSDDTAGDDPA
jgi:hypothetical protein